MEGQAEARHQVIRFLFRDRGPFGIDGDVGLGDDRGRLFAFGVDRKSLQPVHGLGEENGVELHAVEIVAEGAVVDAVIEPLEPPPPFLVMKDVMLSAT